MGINTHLYTIKGFVYQYSKARSLSIFCNQKHFLNSPFKDSY